MDYCRSCGREVTAETRRCPSCGAPIDEFASAQSAAPEEGLQREIQELAAGEGKIAAVKRYREATGSDLKTAKDAVESIMAGQTPPSSAASELSNTVEDEVLAIARDQSKIAAIKRYRVATGCGLKEAKQAVDSLLKDHGIETRGGSGCAGVLMIGLLLLSGLLPVTLTFWWGR